MQTVINAKDNRGIALGVVLFAVLFHIQPAFCSPDNIEIYHGTDCSKKAVQLISMSKDENVVFQTKFENICKQHQIRSNKIISDNQRWKFNVDTSYGIVNIGPVFDVFDKKYLKSIGKNDDCDAKILWLKNDMLIYGIHKSLFLINLNNDEIVREMKFDSYISDVIEVQEGLRVLLVKSKIGKWPWQLLLAVAGHPALYNEFEVLDVNAQFEKIRKIKVEGRFRDGEAIFNQKK